MAAMRRIDPAIVLVFLSSLGCGTRAELVPAEGVVLIAGKPAADIAVQFLPDDITGARRPSSFAMTGPDGRFALRTYDGGAGAVVGMHTVLLVDSLEERTEQGTRPTVRPRIDSRHATLVGGVRVQVTDGGGTIEVDVPLPGGSRPHDPDRH